MLIHRLGHLRTDESVVLGVVRGGVPLAYEISQAMGMPLDVMLVRRMTVRNRPGVTMGALTEDGVRTPSRGLPGVSRCGLSDTTAAERVATAELSRMVGLYRSAEPPMRLDGRTAVVVDDGVISTATAWASCRAARARGAARVVFAAPVIAPDAIACLAAVADETARLVAPPTVSTIASWYEEGRPVTDEQALALLGRSPTGQALATL
ncbi:MAG: phosphoribosyltransferase family protein [Actinocatenispora sp.]